MLAYGLFLTCLQYEGKLWGGGWPGKSPVFVHLGAL
jgi:hypothetical protein